MKYSSGNMFADLPGALAFEEFTPLVFAPNMRIERIVSHSHADPPAGWYDQDWNEWVLVLQGSAGLRFENEAATRTLKRGDYIAIPAHARHRVEWTETGVATIWLAVHYPDPSDSLR